MPDIVYCDNKDCCCYDDYRERCDAYRLVIEHGVCTGSPRHGRNVSENDLDEKFRAENKMLRELVVDWYPHMVKRVGLDALTQWGHLEAMRQCGIDTMV